MATATSTKSTFRIRLLPAAITALAAMTAIIHLGLGAETHLLVAQQPALAEQMAAGGPPLLLMAILFHLNGIGYAALNVAHYLPALRRFRSGTRWLLALIALLLVEGRRDVAASRLSAAPAGA